MGMSIEYYIDSLAQALQAKQTPLEVSNAGYMGAGAVGFAYLTGIIGPAEWSRLSDKITDAALKRIRELDAEKCDTNSQTDIATA